MQSLKELIEVSAHVPVTGYSLELKQLASEGIGRHEALRRWIEKGRTPGSFYKAYKSYKDTLLRLITLDKKDTGEQGKRLETWDKYCAINQLLILGKKMAAVSLATELLEPAKRGGFTEMVVSLSSLLETHFGALEIDGRRYTRYRDTRRKYAEMLADELEVKALQARLVFFQEKGKNIKQLANDITTLKAKTTGSVIFMRYRFSVLSVWCEHHGDTDGLLNAFRETLDVYEDSRSDVSQAVLNNLYFRMTPILSRAGKFAEAEALVSKALQSAREGSQNWHLFMLQRVCLGFDSQKPGIVRVTLGLAQAAPREHDNPDIDRSWELVQQMLAGVELGDVWRVLF